MAKRNRVLGNVLLLVGLFVLAGVLIALIPLLRRAEPIVPPESPEMAAKRFAPENAFFLVAEAVSLLPPLPPYAVVQSKDDPRFQDRYRQEEGSMGWLLGVERPDDDPQLIKYLDACEPAVVKTREALQCPYFLLPIDWARYPEFAGAQDPRTKLAGAGRLGLLLMARGVQASRAGDEAGALKGVLEAIRFRLLLRDEGRMEGGTLLSVLPYIHAMARGWSDATLKQALKDIRALHAEVGPPVANLTFLLRELDCGAFPPMPPPRGNVAERMFQEAVRSYERRQLRKWALTHRDELFDLIEQPFPAVRKRREGLWEEMGKNSAAGKLTSFVSHLASSKAETDVALDGAALIVALERYRRAQGVLPDTLDALVPKCIDEIPKDPFTDGDLVYRHVGEDYQLYVAGSNEKDDGGGLIPEGRTRPLGDDVVIHWPRAAQD